MKYIVNSILLILYICIGLLLMPFVAWALFFSSIPAFWKSLQKGWAKNVLGTVMACVVILLVMPVIGVADAVARWVPTYLAGALAQLPAGAAVSDYLPAAVVSLVATVGLLWLAVAGAGRREL